MKNSSGKANNKEPSSEEVKQSVIDGQLAYENDKADQFTTIDVKDLWT